MILFTKQSFWVTLATFALGSFTTFNTYQLNKSSRSAEDIQQQIMILQESIAQINLRMDNVYDKLVAIEESQGGRK